MAQRIVKETKRKALIDVLKLVSPGTLLRTAVDDISRAEMGGLIVVESPELKNLIEGGFKVNCKLTSQKLVELSKMDGAIIVSEDLDRIIQANVLLFPEISITTNETGTRHKAAERTAKQAGTLVIAISERRKTITLYHGNLRYILKNPEEILSRATETLQILEKQREILDELLSNLNILEISGLVMFSDVCSVLQRMEIIMRTAKTIELYLIELGRDGIIIRMRLRELLKDINKNRDLILRDYGAKEDTLNESSFDDLLDMENVSQLLFSMPGDEKVKTKGYRILSKVNLEKSLIEKLISSFETLDRVLIAVAVEDRKLKRVLGEEYTETFKKEVSSLKEQIVMAKKI